MNLTRLVSRGFCLPCLARSKDEGNSGPGPIQRLSAQTQLPHGTREAERPEDLDPRKDSESTASDKTECIVITRKFLTKHLSDR